MQVKIIKHDFYNEAGQLLSGRLELPSEKPSVMAIFAHCFTCSKNVKAATMISRALAQNGIGVLRFDFTGLGNSEGDFSNTDFTSNVSDLLAAAKSLEIQYKAPALLVGHSFGGAAVLKAATDIKSIRAVVTIGAPGCVNHVAHLFSDNIEKIRLEKKAEVNLFGRKFNISDEFIKNINETDILNDVRSFKKALLVMHSPIDNIVSIDNAAKIFHAAKHPKSFISLHDSDHLISKESDALYISKLIADWSIRYIEKENNLSDQAHDNEKVIINSQQGFKFLNQVSVGQHQLLMDEPASVGGNNLGMTPYQHLLAALGGCTSMTMKLYAELKGIVFDDIKVELTHQKIDKDGKKLDNIVKTITINGDAVTAEQKQKLLEIAEKCPVNRTLKSEIIIESQLK